MHIHINMSLPNMELDRHCAQFDVAIKYSGGGHYLQGSSRYGVKLIDGGEPTIIDDKLDSKGADESSGYITLFHYFSVCVV